MRPRSIKQLSIRILLAMFVCAPLSSISSDAPLSHEPLDKERLEIYDAFLQSWNKGGKRLNLSNRTIPLIQSDLKGSENCLADIHLKAGLAATSAHVLPDGFAQARNVTLVDPQSHHLQDPGLSITQGETVEKAVEKGIAAGLLSLSEVAFDERHQFAVMSYSFVCGGLCGNGSVVVFEKRKTRWQRTNRQCSSWVS